MTALDWGIVITYLCAMLAIGIALERRASSDLASYFVAGRNVPGWIVGTSMVATTFAADTPLAVTGIVAKHGIAGNWFWWSVALGHLAAVFIFARLWRRAEIITDAEITELRYSGRPAAILRLLRAFYFSVPINCIIMAWVIRAMGKIVRVLFPWESWIPSEIYASLTAAWPSWIAISSPSEAISIVLGASIACFYSMLGGLPSVLITDVVQFSLAMVGSIMLAIYALDAVGGMAGLHSKLDATYGAGSSEILAFLPDSDAAWLPLEVFLTYLLVQWWAQKFSDGGGILVQRMSAAKNEAHAVMGTAWFAIAHYALRPWPWIIVGVVATVLFPLTATGELSGDAAVVAADREMAYPVLMASLLPTGVRGIMVAGMAAAFMSTIDTHVNWGASYLVRDVYQRFFRPEATQKQLVRVGRVGALCIMTLALVFSTKVHSVEGAWKFLTAMGAGLGLPTLLRWLWWRINAFSEMAGMLAGAVISLGFYLYGEAREPLPYHLTLLWVVLGSAIAVFTVTLLTPPVSMLHLKAFYERVQPMGFWAPVANQHPTQSLMRPLCAWALSACGLFLLIYGVGEWIFGHSLTGAGACLVGSGLFGLALRLSLKAPKNPNESGSR